MLKKKLALVLIVCSLLMLTACEVKVGEDIRIESTIETARTEIWKAINGGVSSASVAIMKDGQILYEEGFAMADRLASSPVDINTQFNIGSVSKVFTAMAIMQLVEAGKVDLDQPVVNYLEDFTMADERYQNITVRMLLNHSSGLPGTYIYNGVATETDPDFLNHFMNYLKSSQLKSDPGTISVYCNDGFTLSEVLIEKISGLSYGDYMEKNIFSKSGMKYSSCGFKEGSDKALHYGENGRVDPVEYFNMMGTGGISSTASDLCYFGDALLKNKLITQASFDQAGSPQYGPLTTPVGRPMADYGLGWDSVELSSFAEKGVRVLGKNGATLQFGSQFYLLPEQDLTIALLFSGSGDVTSATNAITTAFLDENEFIVDDPQIKSNAMASIPPQLSEFAGYYGNNGTIIKIEFVPLENSMIYKEYNGSEFIETNRFTYMDDGTFQDDGGLDYSFNSDNGRKLLLGSFPQSDSYAVFGEEIIAGNFLEMDAFANKWWLPINLTPVDLYVEAFYTGLIEEIPGVIACGGNDNFTAYYLKDEKQTEMMFEYGRDQATATINSENSSNILIRNGYRYKEVTNIPIMKNKETISIDAQANNSLRLLDYQGSLSLVPIENTRVIVFGPDYTASYDSLYQETETIDVVPGSILSLIGQPGTVFEVNYNY